MSGVSALASLKMAIRYKCLHWGQPRIHIRMLASNYFGHVYEIACITADRIRASIYGDCTVRPRHNYSSSSSSATLPCSAAFSSELRASRSRISSQIFHVARSYLHNTPSSRHSTQRIETRHEPHGAIQNGLGCPLSCDETRQGLRELP